MIKALFAAVVAIVVVLGIYFLFNVNNTANNTSVEAPSIAGQATTTPPVSTTTTSTSTSTSTTSAQPARYTLAEVATHKDRASCWVAIEGKVYDLTNWISRHPGGPGRILGICGTDATAAFTAQHSGDTRPASQLATFLLGDLAQ